MMGTRDPLGARVPLMEGADGELLQDALLKDLLDGFGPLLGAMAVVSFGARQVLPRFPHSLLRRLVLNVTPRQGGRFSMRILIGDPEVYREIWIREDYPLKDLARGKTVADVGAHIGLFTLYALLRLEAKEVRAFEPERENFSLLSRNVGLNGLENRVQLHEVAVTGFGASPEPGVPGIPIQGKLHDTMWARRGIPTVGPEALYGCQVLKMDCEGAELPILTAFPSDRLQEVEAIVFEYHLELYGEEGLRRILDRLDVSGFSCTVSPHKDPRWGIIKAVR